MTPSSSRLARRSALLDMLVPLLVLIRWRVALRQFLVRAITRRYRANALGFLWTIIVPLFTLGIYTFVFGFVMQSRWDTGTAGGSTAPYSLNLFAGLVVFWLMAEAVSQAPGSVIEHTNLVKKALFPLEIIPVVVIGTALFHGLINTIILLIAVVVLGGELHWTALLFPIVLAPFILLLVGFGWILSSLGVYFRDMTPIVGLLMTGVLFLSPVFYAITRLPAQLQTLIVLNPVAFIVIQARRVLLEGQMPDWVGLGIYFVVAWVTASLGLVFFRQARKNFADVL